MACNIALAAMPRTKNSYRMVPVLLCLVIFGLLNGKCNAKLPFPPEKTRLNLLIAVNDSTPPHDLISNGFIDKIQRLINETSTSLFIASKSNLQFDSVTILLPSSWKRQYTGPGEIKDATFETFEDADIQIDDQINDGKNDVPLTIRSEGCGRPGRRIHLPINFITESTSDYDFSTNARILLREFAFYEFGVFEECGYLDSTEYPAIYYHDNQFQITGCMTGNFSMKITQNCINSFYMRTFPLKCDDYHHVSKYEVKSPSLIYKPEWDTAKFFCDEHSHRTEAPTKHNDFCQGKSVMEVIKNNPKYVKLGEIRNEPPKIKIVFKREANYLLLLDDSVAMQTHDKFKTVNLALHHFFNHDVPNGLSVGLATIASNFTIKRNFTTIIDGTSRKQMTNALPDNIDPTPEANIEEAIKNSSKMLQTKTRGVIILITAGKWVLPDVENLCNLLGEGKIRLVIIFCPDSQQSMDKRILDTLNQLSSCSYGTVYVMPDIVANYQPFLLERIKLALRQSLQTDDIPRQNILMEKRYVNSSHNVQTGRFDVDNSVVTNSKLSFRVTYHKDRNVKSVKIMHEDGTSYDEKDSHVYTKNQEIPDIAYKFDMKPGTWMYEINLYEQYKPWPLVATVISEATSKDAITVNVWTNADKPVDASQTPIIVYAEVKQGYKIISNATVTAIIYSPDQPLKGQEMQLYDDGNGDPDVTKDDGIYSRYFTNLTISGYYAIYVRVTGQAKDTVVLEEDYIPLLSPPIEPGDVQLICENTSYRKRVTGMFERFATGPSFYVQKETKNENDYPPNKILDLRLVNISLKARSIKLQWTSPGKNYDHGIVTEYEVRYSLNRNHLQENEFSTNVLVKHLDTPATNQARKLTSVGIQLPATGEHYYIAMRTKDMHNKNSPVSNIVSVHFPPPGTVIPDDHANNQESQGKTANIGLIIGIVVGIIAALVIVVVVCRIMKNRNQGKNTYPVAKKEKKYRSQENIAEEVEITPLNENEDDNKNADAKV